MAGVRQRVAVGLNTCIDQEHPDLTAFSCEVFRGWNMFTACATHSSTGGRPHVMGRDDRALWPMLV
eukprot:1755117-Alexandrium_andersonii.AAC.1